MSLKEVWKPVCMCVFAGAMFLLPETTARLVNLDKKPQDSSHGEREMVSSRCWNELQQMFSTTFQKGRNLPTTPSRIVHCSESDSDGELGQGRQPPGEPLQIVNYRLSDTTEEYRVSLNNENLVKVLSKIGDRKVVILSVCGTYRTGKSFLLNYLLRYLHAKQTGTKLDHSYYGPLTGFKWAQGSTRITTGLILWSEPFELTLDDGSPVAVLLLDTHGLFDDKTPTHMSNLLVSLSVLISSIQVYNVRAVIGENHLQTLELIAATASLALEANEQQTAASTPFQRLVFLVRDWCDEAKHDYGEKGGAEYIRQKFMVVPKELQPVRENIERAFNSLECFLMPSPGEYAMKTAGKRELKRKKEPFSGRFESLSEDFRDLFPELADFLFSPKKLGLSVKRVGDKDATPKQIRQHIQSVVSLFQSGELPPPESTAQVLLDEFNRRIMNRVVQNFIDQMESMKRECPKDIADLEGILQPLYDDATSTFDDQCRGRPQQVDVMRKSLISKLDEIKKTVREICEAKWQGEDGKKTYAAYDQAKLTYADIMKQEIGDSKPYRNPKDFADIHIRAKGQALEDFDREVLLYKPNRGYKEERRNDLESYFETMRELYMTKNEANNKKRTPSYPQTRDLHNVEDEIEGIVVIALGVITTYGLRAFWNWLWLLV